MKTGERQIIGQENVKVLDRKVAEYWDGTAKYWKGKSLDWMLAEIGQEDCRLLEWGMAKYRTYRSIAEY